MNLLDILIVLGLLAFIVSRFLRHKLPKDPRMGNKLSGRQAREDWDKLVQGLGQRATGKATARGKKGSPVVVEGQAQVVADDPVSRLAALDPSFDEARFLSGVEAAYRYFYQHWNAKDDAALDNLCAPLLMKTLMAQLEDYDERGVAPLVDVVRLERVELIDVRVNGRTVIAEVEINAQQAEAEVAEGSTKPVVPAVPHRVVVRWTLARPVGSDDPNWELQAIVPVGGKA